MVAIGFDIRRVDAQHVALRAGAINDQIVDRTAVLRAQNRVLRLAFLEPRSRIGERPFEQFQRARSAYLEFAHVAQVEETRGGAHREMFLDNPAEADRHREAAELGHPRAEP